MKILAWALLVLAALVVLIPPADAKRGGDEGKRRGCSTEHYRLVIEREDVFRLCVLEKQ